MQLGGEKPTPDPVHDVIGRCLFRLLSVDVRARAWDNKRPE